MSWARRRWLDLAGVIAAIVYAAPSLGYPFGLDQPIHAYLGQGLLRGDMPYATGVSASPPGVFVVHALGALVFGDAQWSIRVVDLLFVLGTGALIATFRACRLTSAGPFTRPVQNGELGAACLAVSGFYYTYFDFSDTAHPELWQGFFMLASGWVIVRAPDGRVSPRRALAAGVLACLAVTLEHVALTTGVLCGAAVVLTAVWRRDVRGALFGAAAFTAGVAIVLGLMVLPFWLTGTFDAFWEMTVELVLEHAEKVSNRRVGVPRFLTPSYGLYGVIAYSMALPAGLAITSALRDRRERWVGVWVFVLLLGAAASVLLQRRALVQWEFSYDFIVAVPFLALGLAWALRLQFARRGGLQLLLVATLVAAAFAYAPRWTFGREWSYPKEWSSFRQYVRGRQSFDDYHRAHQNGRFESHVSLTRVAAAIRRRAREGDTLCVDGSIAQLYQLTGLRCSSRFLSGDGVGERPGWRAQYDATLGESPPTFFVTFPDRARVARLRARGYRRRDLEVDDITFAILERRRR